MAIYWHTSPKVYTSIYYGISIVLVSKNAGLIQQSMHTSKSVKRCMNMGMFDIGLSMTQLLKVTLGVTLNISNFCLRVNIFTGMRWLTLQ